MVKLLIIADDFTGALDTGVQFAADGVAVRVVLYKWWNICGLEGFADVLVVDTETRHMHGRDAYHIVKEITRLAIETGIPYLYKKTDSALRGNIGSELTAMLHGSGRIRLHFIPAFPKMERVTKDGIHYIDRIPVSESIFGQDPFEPVLESFVPDIIRRQSDVAVMMPEHDSQEKDQEMPAVVVYDAESDEEIAEIGKNLNNRGQLNMTAGCAGFAAILPDILGLKGFRPSVYRRKEHFLVACGSVNPITVKQLDEAEKSGFTRICLSPVQKLEPDYLDTADGKKELKNWLKICMENQCCILDTNDPPGTGDTMDYARSKGMILEDVRVRISQALGKTVKLLMESGLDSALLITGGDSLLGFMEQTEGKEMTPVCELAPGTVLSRVKIKEKELEVISKSGGFGSENLILDLADKVLRHKEEGEKRYGHIYFKNAAGSL